MSKELIDRLRTHNDDRLYFEADVLMAEAADTIEAQQKRIEVLEARLVYRNSECVTITRKQLRAWLEEGLDDGSIDWRGENEI